MMKQKYLPILAIIVIVGIILIDVFILKPEKTELTRVGLWEDCNPKINDCEIGLECVPYGDDYKCIKYLKEGEECGRSVAEVCGEGLACVDTNENRTVCGVFTTEGGQECFVEPLQICKPKP